MKSTRNQYCPAQLASQKAIPIESFENFLSCLICIAEHQVWTSYDTLCTKADLVAKHAALFIEVFDK